MNVCLWTCTNIRTNNNSRWPEEVFTRFKAEKMSLLSPFVACESKSNLTIFPTSLIKKLLFGGTSCNILIMVLITIVSWTLSSNEFCNNFYCDTNLLMPVSSLLILNKKDYICKWLATINNVWSRHELKMGISGALHIFW